MLAKHSSCSCLDSTAASAKRMEKTNACGMCAKEPLQEEAWLYNGCKKMYYCSTECQTKDW